MAGNDCPKPPAKCVVCKKEILGQQMYEWNSLCFKEAYRREDYGKSLEDGFRSDGKSPAGSDRRKKRCGACYLRKFVGDCWFCNESILEENFFAAYKGHNAHAKCVVCSICSNRFGYAERVWSISKRLYCQRCMVVVTKELDPPDLRSPLIFVPDLIVPSSSWPSVTTKKEKSKDTPQENVPPFGR